MMYMEMFRVVTNNCYVMIFIIYLFILE